MKPVRMPLGVLSILLVLLLNLLADAAVLALDPRARTLAA